MGPRTPVEFTHRRTDGVYERVGNQVELVGAPAGGGGEAQLLPIDPVTGALVTIDEPHYEVHSGDSFRAWYIVPHASPIADNTTVDLVLTTTTRYPHIVFSVGFGGDFEFNIYRGPTFNLNGTVQVAHNLKDLAAAEVATMTARWNPTVTNVGTEIDGAFYGGGTGGNAPGGSIRRGTEDIWRLATSYLVRVTNRAGNAQQFSLVAQWYEEETA